MFICDQERLTPDCLCGEMAERSIAPDCKSGAFGLRRFKSCSLHHFLFLYITSFVDLNLALPARLWKYTTMNKKHHKHSSGSEKSHGGSGWIYGQHAVASALKNPDRNCRRLIITDTDVLSQSMSNDCADKKIRPEIVDKKVMDSILGHGAVHQGIALLADALPEIFIEDILRQAKNKSSAHVLILDQVTDPHNIGAILRSAAAFGSMAVIVQDKNSPQMTGVLAKTASGAADIVPLVRVTNIARAMEQLKEAEFWCLGLDASGEKTLANCGLTSGKVALVLGAEGDGMRRLVAENCDLVVRLPIRNVIDSLNVSNAAAIALYELSRDHDGA